MGVADEYPRSLHYENLPMQYTEIYFSYKIEKFSSEKENEIFLIFAQIDCGCTLEPPHRGESECERHI